MMSLGIDLTEEKMDLTLLRDSIRGPRLKAKARFYLPQGETSPAQQRQYCAQKLRQFVQENSARSAEVIVGLPRRHFLMRNITIPSVRAEDVNRIMRYEADRHIPFEVSQVYYDTIAPPESVRGPGSMDILFVAVRRQTMDELLEPVRIAGLRPSIVDISTFASATAFLERAGKVGGQTAFIEIGEATVILSVLAGTRLRTSRAYPISQILQRAQDGPDAAGSLAEAIAHELNTMAYSAAMEPGEKSFTHLVLTGPGSANPELVASLEKQFELNALLYAPLGQKAELSAEEAADMSRATSLALRGLSRTSQGLNFIPEEHRIHRKDYGPVLAASLAALLVLQVGLLYGHSVYVNKIQVDALRSQFEALMPEADKINELKTEVDTLQARVDELKNIEPEFPPRMILLSELTKHLPKESWIEYMRIQEDAMSLKVRSDPGIQIVNYIARSPYIHDPKLTSQIGDQLSIDATLQFPGMALPDEEPTEEEGN